MPVCLHATSSQHWQTAACRFSFALINWAVHVTRIVASLKPACRYPDAVSLLWDVVRLAPNMPDAYHTLGAVHENIKEPQTAINFYMIAAHLDPKVLNPPVVVGFSCIQPTRRRCMHAAMPQAPLTNLLGGALVRAP